MLYREEWCGCSSETRTCPQRRRCELANGHDVIAVGRTPVSCPSRQPQQDTSYSSRRFRARGIETSLGMALTAQGRAGQLARSQMRRCAQDERTYTKTAQIFHKIQTVPRIHTSCFAADMTGQDQLVRDMTELRFLHNTSIMTPCQSRTERCAAHLCLVLHCFPDRSVRPTLAEQAQSRVRVQLRASGCASSCQDRE